ncbi:MAG: BamA/TamA family outer membrane protein [Leadbetterella sp.]
MKYRHLYFLFMLILISCNVKKNLPKGQKVFMGNTFDFQFDKNDKSIEKESILIFLEANTLPRPNSGSSFNVHKKGVPFKIRMYYGLKLNKKKKTPRLLKSFVEKPVFLSENQTKKNQQFITDYLHTRGYFDANVTSITSEWVYTQSAKYTLDLGKRYRVDSIDIKIDTLDNIGKSLNTVIKKQNWLTDFDLEKIKINRNEIENQLRNEGYYAFQLNNLEILADSFSIDKKINLSIRLKENVSNASKKQYQINDIYVFIDKKPEIQDNSNTDLFRGFLIEDHKKKYNQKLLYAAIAYRPGTLFDNRMQSISNNRLLGLGNFNLIKSDFAIVNQLDSSFIDTYYYLQSQKANSFRFEANAITRTSGLAGSQLNLKWNNTNLFKQAEIFNLTAKTGLEFQLGNDSLAKGYRQNFRLGMDASITFPRFLAPWITLDPEYSTVLPKTQFLIGWEQFIKSNLYRINSLKASLNYFWTKGKGIENTLKPISFNFLKAGNFSSEFIDDIFQNPELLPILDNQLILGGSYAINVLPFKKARGILSYDGEIDLVGNTMGIVDLFRKNSEKKGLLFGEFYAQFIRLQNEVRYSTSINRRLKWANRAFLGIGIPYGNSFQLPLTYQFYVGGNNSLRAFRARGLSPGGSKRSDNLSNQYIGKNNGDIKLEFNTELRYKLNSLLGTALFLDMGNVWMSKDTDIYDENSKFSKNFLRQMALGTGVGIRLDFSFVIVRLDVGIPLYNPNLDSNSRWIIKDFDISSSTKRKENIIWNIAVGLPF